MMVYHGRPGNTEIASSVADWFVTKQLHGQKGTSSKEKGSQNNTKVIEGKEIIFSFSCNT